MKAKSYRILAVIILAAALLIAGVLIRGSAGRWFGGRESASPARVTEVRGEVSILRSGMSYTLKQGVGLRKDDALTAGPKARVSVSLADQATVTADAGSTLTMRELGSDGVRVEVTEGAAVVETAGGDTEPALSISAEGAAVDTSDAAFFSVEAYHGTVTVSVFEGTPNLRYGEREYGLMPGDRVVILMNEEPEPATVSFNRIMSSDLRDLLLEMLLERDGVLFEPELLRQVLDARRTATAQAAVTADGEGLTCTLEIRCDTALDHLDILPEELARSLPADGVLLSARAVAFSDGDTVYDVLRRACLTAGIALEYDYTFNLSGFYVTGLGGLTERGCGPQSGWMYKVNGWFPNYGSSRYLVSDGDVIVWCYSCEGFGTDVGAEPWQSDSRQ